MSKKEDKKEEEKLMMQHVNFHRKVGYQCTFSLV